MTPPEPAHPAPGRGRKTRTGDTVKYPGDCAATQTMLLSIQVVKLSNVRDHLVQADIRCLKEQENIKLGNICGSLRFVNTLRKHTHAIY